MIGGGEQARDASFDPGLGIAFEGCACRAAFHVGAVEWLTENGFRPAAVAGASSGSLVAAALATNRDDRLREAWMELVGSAVCDWRRVLRARWPFRMTEIVAGAAQLVGEPGRMGRAGERCHKIGQQPVLMDIELTSRPRRDDHPPDRLLAAAQFENGFG